MSSISPKQLWAQEQNSLKKQLVYTDSFSWSAPSSSSNQDQSHDKHNKLRYIGGMDLSFVKEDPTIACAALVVIDAETLEPVYQDFELTTLDMPYIPGFLAFREAPALLLLLDRMAATAADRFPQLLLVDGNGILHPRGFGLASHLGVLADIPTIGVAKTLFQVDGLDERTEKQAAHRLLTRAGEWRPLTGMSGRVWGAALRSTNECRKPVFISVGHRISLPTAVAVTAKLCKFRVPEPVRLADKKSREFLKLRGYTESRTGVC